MHSFLLASMLVAHIVGGTITSSYPEVGGLTGKHWAQPTPFCTGTLIRPQIFLTAAHCLFSNDELFNSDNPQPFDPALLQVVFGDQRYDVVSFSIHHHFNFPLNDIALLVLAQPIPDIAPAKVARVSPPRSARATIVGFGDSGGPVADVGKHKREGTVRLRPCPAESDLRTSICWYTRHDGETNSCFGDSGGPVYVKSHASLYLAGIVSGGDGCLTGWSYNTDVAQYRDWMDDEIEKIDSASTAARGR